MDLVIVESPTKAKTISKFLGKGYKVESSFGHIRDLPRGKMGIDIENEFSPDYVIPEKSQKRVSELKSLAKKSDLIYFATDEDREGEAISWHLAEILKPSKGKAKRIAFHEITKEAILSALENPREISLNLVDAQQARRILDRLVGYELSPFLWRKVARGLSAGRVQSVTVRFIAEREREIEKFKSEEYWTVGSILFPKARPEEEIPAELSEISGKKIKQTVKHLLFAGEYSTAKTSISSKKQAEEIVGDLKGAEFKVTDVSRKETRKNPSPPFTTSSLQQAASGKFGFSSKQTMMLAQQLYEGIRLGSEGSVGLITYMRTDSTNLADKFIGESAGYIRNNFGEKYLETRQYKTKAKVAQEAHEAVRPTEAGRTPESVREYLQPRQYKLYDLVWKRAMASQMAAAVLDQTGIEISAGKYLFRASGSTVKFDGFMKVAGSKSEDKILPELKAGEILKDKEMAPEKHVTAPPPRYSEASLIKTLEEFGIGRPSTYAPTMSTVVDRGYVEKDEGKRFRPKDIGLLVNDVLVAHFPKIVDVEFTAKMENDLDEIASGGKKWVPVIRDFYYPFKENLMGKEKEVSKKDLTEEKTDEVCEKCGEPMVIKMGRYGKFLACSGYPRCKNAKPLGEDGKAGEKEEEKTGEKCEKCGAPMIVKHGRFGPFLSCSKYPDCKSIKPIVKATGVKCPGCGKGDIVEKKTRKGKIFYACNLWPKCDFALWQKPTGKKCPDCESLMVYAAGDKTRCSNKECGGAK